MAESSVNIKVIPYKSFYLHRSVAIKNVDKVLLHRIPLGAKREVNLVLNQRLNFSLDYFKASIIIDENTKNILVYWDVPGPQISSTIKMMFKNCLKAVSVSDAEFENPELVIQTKKIRQSKPLITLNIIGILMALALVYFSFTAINNEEWWIDLAFLIGTATVIRLFFQLFSAKVYSNSAFYTFAFFSLISLLLAITGDLDFKFKTTLTIIPQLLTLKAYGYYIMGRKVEL